MCVYVYIINIHKTHKYIMQTKTCILYAIKRLTAYLLYILTILSFIVRVCARLPASRYFKLYKLYCKVVFLISLLMYYHNSKHTVCCSDICTVYYTFLLTNESEFLHIYKNKLLLP